MRILARTKVSAADVTLVEHLQGCFLGDMTEIISLSSEFILQELDPESKEARFIKGATTCDAWGITPKLASKDNAVILSVLDYLVQVGYQDLEIVRNDQPVIIKMTSEIEEKASDDARQFYGCRYERGYQIYASDPSMGTLLIVLYVGFDFAYVNITH